MAVGGTLVAVGVACWVAVGVVCWVAVAVGAGEGEGVSSVPGAGVSVGVAVATAEVAVAVAVAASSSTGELPPQAPAASRSAATVRMPPNRFTKERVAAQHQGEEPAIYRAFRGRRRAILCAMTRPRNTSMSVGSERWRRFMPATPGRLQ